MSNTFNNGDSGLSIRNKLNETIVEVETISTNIEGIEQNIDTLNEATITINGEEKSILDNPEFTISSDGITDVKVNDESVVTNKIAEITLPETYTKTEINSLLAQINTAEFIGPFEDVSDIPTPYDTNDLYLVGTEQPFKIFVYIEADDELIQIGSTEVDLSDYRKAVDQDVIDATKQDILVSGTNIKTINGNSLLGSENIEILSGIEVEGGTEPKNLIKGMDTLVYEEDDTIVVETAKPEIIIPEYLGDWTTRTSVEDNSWNAIAYGNGLFVAVATTGTNRIMASPDGINWTARLAPVDNQWRAITYGDGLFVAIANTGTNNRVMTSPDGINWTIRTTPTSNNWYSIAYGNGMFVAVSMNGGFDRVMTSPDGINWTAQTTSEVSGWASVTYGNGLFVAIANTGEYKIMTSPDGINWTPRTAPVDVGWYSVTYGKGMFVAVSTNSIQNSKIMTSTDGIEWDVIELPIIQAWHFVTYGNGLFVAISHSGTNRAMISKDGINWTMKPVAIDNSWYGVAYGDDKFVAVSNTGTGDRVMTMGWTPEEIKRPAMTRQYDQWIPLSETDEIISITDIIDALVTRIEELETIVDSM